MLLLFHRDLDPIWRPSCIKTEMVNFYFFKNWFKPLFCGPVFQMESETRSGSAPLFSPPTSSPVIEAPRRPRFSFSWLNPVNKKKWWKEGETCLEMVHCWGQDDVLSFHQVIAVLRLKRHAVTGSKSETEGTTALEDRVLDQ